MPTPRKARTPATLSRVRFDDGPLECEATWDPGNGTPISAWLLPVANLGGGWTVVDRDGQPLGRVEEIELAKVDFRSNPVSIRPVNGRARISVAWPDTAAHCVLVLLHPQLNLTGGKSIPIHDFATRLASDPQAAARRAARVAAHRAATERVENRVVLSYLLGSPSDLVRGVVQRKRAAATAPRPGTNVQTAPTRAAAFALASCQYPATLLDRGVFNARWANPDHAVGPAERSLSQLANAVFGDAGIGFSVLAGDQVYVDATAGLFDPANLLDRFGFAYQAMTLNKGFARLASAPDHDLFPVLDDHEIRDDWEPLAPAGDPKGENRKAARDGIAQYVSNQRARYWPTSPSPTDEGLLWQQRQVRGWNFFFADTRTLREGRSVANWRVASLLGQRQDKALLAWIANPQGVTGVTVAADPPPPGPVEPRFVVSPSLLLPRRLALRRDAVMALHADSWCGYPKSLQCVLAQLYDTKARGVVFLSGDEHISCVARIEISCDDGTGDMVHTHSVHSSALYAPYPFANSRPEDFPLDDEFAFPDPFGQSARTYRCKVATAFPSAGDGFAILRPGQDDQGDWQVQVDFHRAGTTQVERPAPLRL